MGRMSRCTPSRLTSGPCPLSRPAILSISSDLYMVCAHETIARVDRGALDDGQDVALHALAADVRTMPAFAPGDLIDLVQKNDAARFHPLQRGARHLVHVDEFRLLFLHQIVQRLGHPHLALPRFLAE